MKNQSNEALTIKIGDPQLEKAKKLYELGKTVEEVAATTGLSLMAVKGATTQKNKLWNDDEISLLKSLAGKASTDYIASKVKKTKRQVQHKAQRLGLSLAFINRKPKSWTTTDVRYLKTNAGVISGVQIARHLDRPVENVYRKAHLLNLSLHVLGENSHAATYSNEDIELCRALFDAGLKAPTIAQKMEMSRSFVHQVIKHERRAYL
ncbi:hypothetical protein VSAK1_13661 [Vibrio mediterranei AK1]|jgi:predicted transcriptional regulator|uniref:hypothetical protein n=1 Tax=Vibrio mediterranei TaxID=689 RepID=UPI0001542109|nr:hypothetical protein [Vibrio mediterranei]EDL52597.1 hypothetical protein VSAK1_13661 [Vibrio mediterranei AK1]